MSTKEHLKAAMMKVAAFVKDNPKATVPEIAAATGVPQAAVITLAQAVARKKRQGAIIIPSHLPNEEVNALVATDIVPAAPVDREFYTDFDQMVDDQNQAQVGSDGQVASDLAQQAGFQAIQNERRAAKVQPVRVTPGSVTPESPLGGQAVVTSGQVAPSVVFWQGENDEAVLMNVSIGRVANLGAPNFPTATRSSDGFKYSYRPYAFIRWGTRSFMHQATVDVGRGVQLTLAGSSVFVDLGMDVQLATEAPGTMNLGATIGFWGSNPSTKAQRTGFATLLASGTANIIIPDFATELLPVQRTTGAGGTDPCDITINVKNAAGTVISVINLAAGIYMICPAPLPDDAYSIDIVNNDSGAGCIVRAMFGLSL